MYNVMKRIWEINIKWPSESRVRVLNTLANILRLKVSIVLRRYVNILDYLHRDHYDKILSFIVCYCCWYCQLLVTCYVTLFNNILLVI